MLNNKGPSTDPCGTPCIKTVHELKVLLIFTRCFLLLKGGLSDRMT